MPIAQTTSDQRFGLETNFGLVFKLRLQAYVTPLRLTWYLSSIRKTHSNRNENATFFCFAPDIHTDETDFAHYSYSRGG